MSERVHGRLDWVLVVGTLLVAMMLFAAKPAASQNGAAKGRCVGCSVDGKTTPMTPDGHPDLSGYWSGTPGRLDQSKQQFERSSDGSVLFDFSLTQGNEALCASDDCQYPNQPPYSAAYLPRVKAIAKTEFAGTSPEDPMTACKPTGVPRSQIGGVQIIQSPQVIAMVHGDYTDRIIYMNREHPKDMDPSYMGNSVGHWEGNTLVVDVAGFNDDTWLGGSLDGKNMYTSIHSDKEHVVERWTREGDTITYEATVEDPVALTKPWVLAPRTIHIDSDPDAYVQPYFCEGSTALTMQQHYVKPNPEDRDVKYKCNGHHCDAQNHGYTDLQK